MNTITYERKKWKNEWMDELMNEWMNERKELERKKERRKEEKKRKKIWKKSKVTISDMFDKLPSDVLYTTRVACDEKRCPRYIPAVGAIHLYVFAENQYPYSDLANAVRGDYSLRL